MVRCSGWLPIVAAPWQACLPRPRRLQWSPPCRRLPQGRHPAHLQGGRGGGGGGGGREKGVRKGGREKGGGRGRRKGGRGE